MDVALRIYDDGREFEGALRVGPVDESGLVRLGFRRHLRFLFRNFLFFRWGVTGGQAGAGALSA